MNLQFNNIRKVCLRVTILLLLVAYAFGMYPLTDAALVSAACASKYTVVAGDTLTSIAWTYDVSLEDLAAANDLKEPYTIYIGQVLCIPGSSSSSDSDADDSSDDDDGGSISAAVDGLYLDVSASGMTKHNNFYVKARRWRYRYPGSWYKLGLLNMGKNTSMKESYRLLPGLRDVDALEVCLKNAVTDDLYCTIIAPDL